MSELKLPHRVTQHEIDNEACKIVISKFDRNWEIRDLTGRDFGIDKIVERFQDGYATSELLLLQIKGTENEIDINNPRFSLDTKELQYAEMFTTPFLLVYVSITNPQQCYYVWLQEYIRVRLQLDKPNWREQDTNTIYFPKENILNLNERMDHILYITKFATVYKGNIIKNLIMDCQSYTKYRPNETTGGIFVSWRRKEELPTGA